tara:strand:- start:712 stop:1056 length:345 start_codon:yes stop_codon:yes gene_type:complete
MVDKSKRCILIKSLFVLSIPSLVKSAPFIGQSLKNNKSSEEFVYVYKSWVSFFSEEPIDYLKSRGVTGNISFASIKDLSVKDFRCGNTLDINGFVLSKIEVSLIASIGAQYFNN